MNIKLVLITTSSLLISSINCFMPLLAETNNITQISPVSVTTSVQNLVSTENDRALKANEKENRDNISIETTAPNPETTEPEITADEEINDTDVEEAVVIEEEDIDNTDVEDNFEDEDGLLFLDEDFEEEHIQNEPPIQGFILQHRIDKGIPLSQDEIEGELQILLQTLKEVIVAARLEKPASKQLRIDTVIEILLSEYLSQVIEADLPLLSAQTKINSVGKGRTIFKLPAFHYQNGEDVLAWTGLKSQLSFTDKFEKFKAILKIADFHFDDEYELLSVKKMRLKAIFDADLILKQIELNLPFLKMDDEDGELEIQNLVFNLNLKKSHKGVEIDEFTLTIGQLIFDDGISKVQLHQMVLMGNGEAQNDVLNYTLQLQIGQWAIASLPGKTLPMRFQGTLEFRHIDLDAVIEWQTSIRELKKQRQQGNISEDVMIMGQLFKLNEILPKILVKSPELVIPQLYINSTTDQIRGKLLFSIDGDKATSLKNSNNWLPVLTTQIELNIGKHWLAKMLEHYVYHTLQKEVEAIAETESVENDTLLEVEEVEESAKKESDVKNNTLTKVEETAEEAIEEHSVENNTLTEAEEKIEEATEESIEEPSVENNTLTEEELADLQIQAKAKSEQQLKQYVEQKWLVNADADNYKLLLNLSDNQLMINGQEKPLLLQNFSLLKDYFENDDEVEVEINDDNEFLNDFDNDDEESVMDELLETEDLESEDIEPLSIEENKKEGLQTEEIHINPK